MLKNNGFSFLLISLRSLSKIKIIHFKHKSKKHEEDYSIVSYEYCIH